MLKDAIFFGEKGMTSTSANYVANLAKEYIQTIDSKLSSVSFVKEEIKLLGATTAKETISEGCGEDFLAQVESLIDAKAKATSLIAWLREAIKAKENLLNEVKSKQVEEYIKMMGYTPLEIPEERDTLTEDKYLSELSVKERNRYFELESMASVIGSCIHAHGKSNLASQRKELKRRIDEKPNDVEGNGRDTVIRTFTPTVSAEAVDEVFFKLQNKHREVQAELNSMKHKCETAVTNDEIAAESEYNAAYSEYANKLKELNNELNAWKKKEGKRVSELKIIVPNSLEDIYKEISSLGKKD